MSEIRRSTGDQPPDAGGRALEAQLMLSHEHGRNGDRWDKDVQGKDTVQVYTRYATVVLRYHGARMLRPGDTFLDETPNDAAGLIAFAMRVRADGGALLRRREADVWHGATVRMDGPALPLLAPSIQGDREPPDRWRSSDTQARTQQ